MSANQRGLENGETWRDGLFAVDAGAVKIGKEIGKGAFSVVYAGEYHAKRVAVKCQPKDDAGEVPAFVLKEVRILQRLQHANILAFIGAADNRKTRQILILSEYSNNGDLDQLLRAIRKQQVAHPGWRALAQIALDAARGIAFLHAQRIIHRDIKSSNILLDDKFRAKLCDFGFATEMSWWTTTDAKGETTVRRKSYCGTDAYMAPEMFLDEDYNENVDIFSFGVVLMELLCCRQANRDGFLMRLPQHKFEVQLDEFRDALPARCPAVLTRLAEQCAAFEPAQRPTSSQVVKQLEAIVSQRDLDTSGLAIELRPFVPIEQTIVSCEPEMDDQDEDDPDDENDDDLDDEDCSTQAGSILHTLEEDADATPVLPPAYHKGVLFKRNPRGKRAWAEKTFVLDRDQLRHIDKTGEAARHDPMATLALQGCRLWKTTEMPELCFHILNSSWKIKRELRALNRADLETWMTLLEQGIDYANEHAAPSRTLTDKPSKHRSKSCEDEHRRPKKDTEPQTRDETMGIAADLGQDDVDVWLSRLGLHHYAHTLKAKGFISLDFIRETGIEKEDLNFLGIKDTSARKTLRDAARILRGGA